jgi:5-hydroxyisourate hydrolase
MPGKLSTHVLDISRGSPARDMQVELWRLSGGPMQLLKTARTNADGRTDTLMLGPEEMLVGEYELIFLVGNYFAGHPSLLDGPPFLDRVPVRFGIADASASYHVPLICSPWAYSTYRGS